MVVFMDEVYKKKCERCGKEITSLSKRQLEQNFQVHKMACDKKHKDGKRTT